MPPLPGWSMQGVALQVSMHPQRNWPFHVEQVCPIFRIFRMLPSGVESACPVHGVSATGQEFSLVGLTLGCCSNHSRKLCCCCCCCCCSCCKYYSSTMPANTATSVTMPLPISATNKHQHFQWCKPTTWAPKVCKIMAFMAIIMGLGLLFYILLGFRYCCSSPARGLRAILGP